MLPKQCLAFTAPVPLTPVHLPWSYTQARQKMTLWPDREEEKPKQSSWLDQFGIWNTKNQWDWSCEVRVDTECLQRVLCFLKQFWGRIGQRPVGSELKLVRTETCSSNLLRERPFLSYLTLFCGSSSVITHESWPQCLSVPGGTCMPKTLTNSGTCQPVLCIHITTLT